MEGGSIHPYPALHTYICLTKDDSTRGVPGSAGPGCREPSPKPVSAMRLQSLARLRRRSALIAWVAPAPEPRRRAERAANRSSQLWQESLHMSAPARQAQEYMWHKRLHPVHPLNSLWSVTLSWYTGSSHRDANRLIYMDLARPGRFSPWLHQVSPSASFAVLRYSSENPRNIAMN